MQLKFVSLIMTHLLKMELDFFQLDRSLTIKTNQKPSNSVTNDQGRLTKSKEKDKTIEDDQRRP